MHRMKIGLAAAGVLLLVTLGVYASVASVLKDNAVSSVEKNLARAERAFSEIGRLRAADAAMQAFVRAKRPSVVGVFAKTEETARRQAAFEEVEAQNAGLQKEGRQAAIVAILGADGKVIARDLNPNAMFGDDLKSRYPAVERALKGEPVKDVWTMDNRTTEVALAPISRSDGWCWAPADRPRVVGQAGARDPRQDWRRDWLLPRREDAGLQLRQRRRSGKRGRQQDPGSGRSAVW